MDKQFQRLLELEKKKDAGTISKSEQTRIDKIIWKYIRKMGNEILKYQSLLIEQQKVIDKQNKYLTVADKAMKDAHQFLEQKGLLEEFKAVSQQTEK